MKYGEGMRRVREVRARITALRAELRALQSATEPQPIDDYELATLAGPVRLSQLFGTHKDLIVIHNMGRRCAYCTLWADGYNGIYPQLLGRAAFIVTSPDSPQEQAAFASERGWRFPMVSHAGSRFAFDLGFAQEPGRYRPGVSALRRDGARLLRVSDTASEPGDDFCAVWHLFDLLPGGAAGWRPSLRSVQFDQATHMRSDT